MAYNMHDKYLSTIYIEVSISIKKAFCFLNDFIITILYYQKPILLKAAFCFPNDFIPDAFPMKIFA